ncbi:cardioactive peptide isoform X2 [Bacillus rossius redtenbacheri]|uniref:cardioactive peptide isoform X2 n=1 Tax=Bacillus rossius redtenbacheri TaxID=93214 RepID=UPI002FDCE0D7
MQMLHVVMAGSLVALLATLGLPHAAADEVIVQKREVDPAQMERLLDPKRKRPFCNAFTGCGKKRSDESMATLVEMNSEPAVEELTRQILSEAKLWEAIQEARIELLRRKHQQQMAGSQEAESAALPLPLRLASYRRKRSADSLAEDMKNLSR